MVRLGVKAEPSVRILVAKKGYSLRACFERISVSHGYLSQVLNGKRNPSPVVARKIAEGLDQDIEDIFFVNGGS